MSVKAPVRVSFNARVLTQRACFLRIKAGGLKVSCQAFSLQYESAHEGTGIGLGFTCAKRSFKTGVAANRARRRLKAAWQACAIKAPQGFNYVVVGKLPVLTIEFKYLVRDMEGALAKVAALDQTA